MAVRLYSVIIQKGREKRPNNYRAMSIVSCLFFLYYLQSLSTIQFSHGRRIVIWHLYSLVLSGLIAVDSLLFSMICITATKHRRLYCCFEDFEKALTKLKKTQPQLRYSHDWIRTRSKVISNWPCKFDSYKTITRRGS